MSLSLTARYLHIAATYTFHAGRAARRVWDTHSLTPRTLQAALNTANSVIHLCIFVYWLLNESDWSTGNRSAKLQTAATLEPTPIIEEKLKESTPAPQSDTSPTIEAIEAPIDSELSAAPLPSLSWTKADLVQACRNYGLKPTGAKTALVERLLHQLE